jgi:glycosyltransferase involved in cell wall biosynthesis
VRRAGRDAVYVNTTVLPAWVLLARLARRRVVVHVHEAEWPGPAGLQRLLLAPLLAADRVVANSAFTAAVLTRRLPALAERTVVVPNPVHAAGEVQPARPRIEGPVRLLYVGRLSPRKGPQVAVAALAALLDRGVDARLSLVGSVFEGYEWFEDQLRATVRAEGLADRVDFVGFRAEVRPLLVAADAVLVPSLLDESFGNTAVEAVMAGRPVVVSALGGLREATEGFTAVRLVEPGRPDLWADAVAGLVADWDRVREAAARDAGEARRRHDPWGYRERLLAAVAVGRPAAQRVVSRP